MPDTNSPPLPAPGRSVHTRLRGWRLGVRALPRGDVERRRVAVKQQHQVHQVPNRHDYQGQWHDQLQRLRAR